MDIIDFTDELQKIEVQHDFFMEKDIDGVLYWDIVRHHIFQMIYYEICKTEFTTLKTTSFTAKCKVLFKNVSGYFKFVIKLSRKRDYISFIASRNMGDDGKSIDHISNDILQQIYKDSLIIETFTQQVGTKRYNTIFNYGLKIPLLKLSIKNKFFKPQIPSYAITSILKKTFLSTKDLDSIIYHALEAHKASQCYYEKILKKIKPKAIFIVQNGVQKGLFKAAHYLSIPVIELQHGLIGYVHPAYSYPSIIKNGQLETLPDIFIAFSNFWVNNVNYPVKESLALGNNFYATKVQPKEKLYDLTFIFANIYSKDLLLFLNELLVSGYEGMICIKLHPNQFYELDSMMLLYENYKNVNVIASQKSMKDILAQSKSIFAIQSTAVYEALHNQVKVYLYKIKDYRTHNDVLQSPNVYLVDNALDIAALDTQNFQEGSDEILFEKFKQKDFKTLLNNL